MLIMNIKKYGTAEHKRNVCFKIKYSALIPGERTSLNEFYSQLSYVLLSRSLRFNFVLVTNKNE